MSVEDYPVNGSATEQREFMESIFFEEGKKFTLGGATLHFELIGQLFSSMSLPRVLCMIDACIFLEVHGAKWMLSGQTKSGKQATGIKAEFIELLPKHNPNGEATMGSSASRGGNNLINISAARSIAYIAIEGCLAGIDPFTKSQSVRMYLQLTNNKGPISGAANPSNHPILSKCLSRNGDEGVLSNGEESKHRGYDILLEHYKEFAARKSYYSLSDMAKAAISQ